VCKYKKLSVRNESEKITYYLISIIRHSENGKSIETAKRSVVTRGLRKGRGQNEQNSRNILWHE
jgi:hypothetical protein